jgi:hypothetical protein
MTAPDTVLYCLLAGYALRGAHCSCFSKRVILEVILYTLTSHVGTRLWSRELHVSGHVGYMSLVVGYALSHSLLPGIYILGITRAYTFLVSWKQSILGVTGAQECV